MHRRRRGEGLGSDIFSNSPTSEYVCPGRLCPEVKSGISCLWIWIFASVPNVRIRKAMVLDVKTQKSVCVRFFVFSFDNIL